MAALAVRDASKADLPLLEEMLIEAAFWRGDRGTDDPGEALRRPELRRYLAGWGRRGDTAVVALIGGRPVGAAWFRLFQREDHGYGFVDETVPELTIAVRATHRGQGVGGHLLDALVERARREGYRALSLSVEPDNPARQLYERRGFQRVAVVGDAWTMLLDLAQAGLRR